LDTPPVGAPVGRCRGTYAPPFVSFDTCYSTVTAARGARRLAANGRSRTRPGDRRFSARQRPIESPGAFIRNMRS
jgi:hypothetical protein